MARLVLNRIFGTASGGFIEKRNLLWRVMARTGPRRLAGTLFRKRRAGEILALLPWERIFAFPPCVGVELTTSCNLHCPMCPREAMAPRAAVIEERLFRKVVDEVVRHKGVLFLPGGRGEGMLHPRWEECITYAKRSGVSPMRLVTNATLLNRERASLLVDLAVEQIMPSIDGATKKTYEAIRVGANFEQVVGNVRQLIEVRRKAGATKPQIILRFIRMSSTEHEVGAFVESWNEYLDEQDKIEITQLSNWVPYDDADWVTSAAEASGFEAALRHAKLLGPCGALWKKLTVRYDGTMSACCPADQDITVVDANAYTDSLEAAWRSKQLRRVRRLHLLGRQLEHPLCRRCLALMCGPQVKSLEEEGVDADRGL